MNLARFLLLSVLLAQLLARSAEPPELGRAEAFHRSGMLKQAAEAYRAALARNLDSAAEIRALYGSGKTLAALGDHASAITNYQRLLARHPRSPGPLTPPYVAANVYEEIGASAMALGDYRKALEALEHAERNPVLSICGYRGRRAGESLKKAICYDHLGDLTNALRGYIRGAAPSLFFIPGRLGDVHLRILAIYESAGELPKLLNLLDELDCDKIASYFTPFSGTIRRTLAIRDSAARRDWTNLVQTLNKPALEEWEYLEAMRPLAANSAETVPLLTGVAQQSRPISPYLARALGSCGTPDALAFLKAGALAPSHAFELFDLIAGLRAAGENARPYLDELVLASRTNAPLRTALSTPSRPLTLYDSELPKLPTRQHLPPLPATVQELGL